MIDFGTVRPGTTLYVPFATYDSNDPTASVTMTGLAVTDIEIYKDGGTTQRGSDAGYTLLDTDGIDFDGVTGIHGFSINLADNTTAGFYASGSQYWVVVSSVTVDSGTINFIAATFRIGYPDAILNTTIATLASQTSFTLTAGPADDNALLGCVALIHDVASSVQMAMGVVSAYTGSTKTVTLVADPGVFTIAATDNISFYFPTNTRWVGGTAQTAGDIYPAVAGIGTAGSSALNVECTIDNVLGGIPGVTSGTTFVGTQISGTYASTSHGNAEYQRINGTGSGNTVFDIIYQFLLGSGTSPVRATWTGIMNSSDDTLVFDVWRHDTNAWEPTVATVTGTNSATVQTRTITLYSRHRGTSAAELGKVYIRLKCTGTDTPTIYTDQLGVSYALTSRGDYSDGAVWLNTNASNTNTQNYVDGVPENPVSTLAAAITICDALKLKRIRVANGSTVTFASSMSNRSLVGRNWTCALDGQTIDNTYIEGAEISGIGSCTSQAEFVDCHINNSTTTGPVKMLRCGFNMGSGTPFAGGSAGQFMFVDCFSEVASGGVTTPYFTFTGASAVMFRRYSGGANITMDASTGSLTYEVIGGGNLTAALAGADLEVRGMPRDITVTGITSASTVRINCVTGAISLAGADGAATIYGVCGVVTDSRTGSPTLTNKAISQDNPIGSVTGAIGSLATQAKADVNAEVVDVLRTDTIPDAYSTHEAQPTFAQAVLAIHQFLFEREVSGTSVTIQKPDGSTTAMTLTLNDGTNPTTIHRSA